MPDITNVVFKDTFKANILALVADAYIYSHGRYDITDYKAKDNPFCINVMLDHGFTALKKPQSANHHPRKILLKLTLGWIL